MEAEYVSIRLMFVRHGETQHNKTRTLAGQLPGKLTALGRQQAGMIGTYFHAKKQHFDFVYVSDLGRTKQTYSCALQKAPHLGKISKKQTDLIREKSAGILENKPLGVWQQNAKKEGKNIRQYKCKNGESWEDVFKRAKLFLKLVIQENIIAKAEQKKQISAQQKILAVSHGGFIMQFHNLCKQINKEKVSFDNSAKNCSMHQFLISYPKGQLNYDESLIKIRCTEFNFVGHLTK